MVSRLSGRGPTSPGSILTWADCSARLRMRRRRLPALSNHGVVTEAAPFDRSESRLPAVFEELVAGHQGTSRPRCGGVRCLIGVGIGGRGDMAG